MTLMMSRPSNSPTSTPAPTPTLAASEKMNGNSNGSSIGNTTPDGTVSVSIDRSTLTPVGITNAAPSAPLDTQPLLPTSASPASVEQPYKQADDGMKDKGGGEPKQNVSDGEFVKKIVKKAVQDVIRDAPYSHEATNTWTNKIVEMLVRQLVQIDRDYKYIVTCMIVQNLNQGMRSATSCFWNAQTDTGYSLTNECNGILVCSVRLVQFNRSATPGRLWQEATECASDLYLLVTYMSMTVTLMDD